MLLEPRTCGEGSFSVGLGGERAREDLAFEERAFDELPEEPATGGRFWPLSEDRTEFMGRISITSALSDCMFLSLGGLGFVPFSNPSLFEDVIWPGAKL